MSDAVVARRVLIPGPDHPITVSRNPKRIVVTANGTVIADTRAALTLEEASYPPVQYIPRADTAITAFERSEHSSYCPYKGEASYFSIPGIDKGENAIWTYETPYDAVAEIRNCLAFYPDRVTIEERDD
jgi:uncharacterized protein (DUF427 family)